MSNSPQQKLKRLINGFQVSQAIHVAATLGVADRLDEGPLTSAQLGKMTGSHPGALYRLLRALAAAGVFHEDDEGRFSLTRVGAALRQDSPNSRGAWARLIARPPLWESWGQLLHAVRTGENAFRHVHGMDVWEHRAAKPEEGAIFDLAMREGSTLLGKAISAAYDFGRIGRIVDIGGSDGALLACILIRHPQVRGTVFDMPHVVSRAAEVLRAAGVAHRCETAGGSFFDRVPGGGDVYLLKFIIHDWDDAQASSILRCCRNAMGSQARLLVIERIIAPPNEGADGKFSDLNMLVNAGGRERTLREFDTLFAAAGLVIDHVMNIADELSMFELSATDRARQQDGEAQERSGVQQFPLKSCGLPSGLARQREHQSESELNAYP
jgi:O-methyltransferase domain/Dimerisation domain